MPRDGQRWERTWVEYRSSGITASKLVPFGLDIQQLQRVKKQQTPIEEEQRNPRVLLTGLFI